MKAAISLIIVLSLEKNQLKEENAMASNIKAVLPLAYDQMYEDSSVKNELLKVQEYFDHTDLEMTDPSLYFIALKGAYTHISRKLFLIAVFTNNTGKLLKAFKATVKLKIAHHTAELAETQVSFPPEFLGVFHPNEGMLVHINIPVRGLEKDQIFEARDFISEVTNITISTQN